MIKNTTLTPHRSLYIPGHTQYALGIIGKYQYTTDNYLGMLGLIFRENSEADSLDTAPIYQYLVHLRLQILQLQHANNHFMGLRSTTLQMLQQKINTNIELHQINQLLNQHEASYSNNSMHNNSITMQMIDRRSEISQMLTTPAYGRSIHSVQQSNEQRIIRLVDHRLSMKVQEGDSLSTSVYEANARTNHVHLSKLNTQIWNPFLERIYKRESNRLITKYITDNSQSVAFIKSLIQIDPIPPSSNQTWKPGKSSIELRRSNIRLIDTKWQGIKGEQSDSSPLFPAAINFNTVDIFFNQQSKIKNSETLNSNYFADSAAFSRVMNSYLNNYNSAFGSTFVQYIVNKLSQISMYDELSEATNYVLIDRSLTQREISSTNEIWSERLNLVINNRNTAIRNNNSNIIQTELGFPNILFKKMQTSAKYFFNSIIKKQAYFQNESNEFNTSNEIIDNRLNHIPRLQLTVRSSLLKINSTTNEIWNDSSVADNLESAVNYSQSTNLELSINNLFFKSMRESSDFVQYIIKKQAYSQIESIEFNSFNENKQSKSLQLQLILRSSNWNAASAKNKYNPFYNLKNEHSIHNLFYKRMHESSNFVQFIVKRQAYSQNESNENNTMNEINERKISFSPRLQLINHYPSLNFSSPTNEKRMDSIILANNNRNLTIENNLSYNPQNEGTIHNLFFKRMQESSDFVKFILEKQAYLQDESHSYNQTTEINTNMLNILPRLQLIVHNPSVESGTIANPDSSTLLQIDHILLKKLNSKSIHYKNGLLKESIHFVNSLIHKREHFKSSSSSEFNTTIRLVDQRSLVQEITREKTTQTVKLKPYFLFTDTNSQVFQQFRINLIESQQLFETLLQPDSIVQPANRYYVNRIVQAHLIEQSEVMQLNPVNENQQFLLNYPISLLNENKLSSWVQLNPQQLEQQSLINNNFVNDAQFDLNLTMYSNMNAMQLVDRNYSTNLALNEVNRIQQSQPLLLSEVTVVKTLRNSIIMQQVRQEHNDRKLISLRTSLSPVVFQKFSLTQSRIRHDENEITQALMNVQANTIKSITNKQSFIEQVVQAHINNWSAQIQFLPTLKVNHLLTQVENELKSNFNEMNVDSIQIYKQSLTLVDRAGIVNNQQLTDSAGFEQLPLLLQSKEIVQNAAFLKQKVRELQAVNNNFQINIKVNKSSYFTSNLPFNTTLLKITKSSGLNSNIMQQLWLNNQILQQAADNLNYNNVTSQIIRNRIGDIAQVIQLNSKQVNNHLLLQSHYQNVDLSSRGISAAAIESGFTQTHLIKLVDRKLNDRGLLNQTLVITQQQMNLHKTNLQNMIQHYQSMPVKLSIELKQLDPIVNTSRIASSGPVISIRASLSPLIYEKYSIHLLDNQSSVKPLKRSLSLVKAMVGVPIELSNHLIESNNLTEKIVNERIHSLSSLILQMPLSTTNLLLHQLNLDTYSMIDIEKKLYHTNNQQRLELVDRKAIERGGVNTKLAEIYEKAFEQIRTLQNISSNSLMVSLDNSANQQNKRSFIQKVDQTRNLMKNIYNTDKTLHNYYHSFQDRYENSTQSTSYLQLNLIDNIIRERIGEVSSILQLNPGHDENLLFYAADPIVTIKEKNMWLHKEMLNLKLIDRKQIDRGIEAAMNVIMLQQGAEQRVTKQFLINSSNELNGYSTAILQSVPILRQVIRQLKDHTTEIHSNRGPVVSFLTSLSPMVYQKFWYRNQPAKQALEQQLKRQLSQSADVDRTESSRLHYRENLTEKIVRERVDEMTHSTHLMALTNTNQISTQAQIQMISQAQQEQEKPLSAIESAAETTSVPSRTHLMLVDRNHMDSNTVQLLKERLVQQLGVQERSRPAILIDRANPASSQSISKETRLVSSVNKAIETHILFRELLTKKVVKAQINELLTQTERPLSMQSLQKDQINQKFIEKITTKLLIANERTESNESVVHNERNESYDRISSTNNESLLINRRNNQDVAETMGTLSVIRDQSEATLDYLKAKSNAVEPIQQSVANILQQKDSAASGEVQNNSKVTSITKLEFDKIVDRVYKELQKRFTYERQRRGM